MHYGSTSLQKRNPVLGQFRFYTVSVQPNLFGSFSLIREWGRIGSKGQVRIDFHASEEEALTFMQRKIQEKRRRGYR